MADNYESILERQWGDLLEITVRPVGSWLLRGLNVVRKAPTGEGSESLLFVYEVKEPMDDVDEDELKGLGDDYDYDNNRIYARFWVDNVRDVNAVKNHLVKHGIELNESVSVIDSAKENFKGTEVVAYLDTRSYENSMGETVLDNNPTSFAPIE